MIDTPNGGQMAMVELSEVGMYGPDAVLFWLTAAFFWIAFCLVVAVAARTRGRHGSIWFVLSVLLTPLVAGLFLLALPSRADRLGADWQ